MSLFTQVRQIQLGRVVFVRSIFAGLLFVFIFSGISCGVGSFVRGVSTRTKKAVGVKLHVRAAIDEDANFNTPVAVDLVFVQDEDLLNRLMQDDMTAAKWFAARDDIKRDYLPGKGLVVHSWEWTPGQNVPPMELSLVPGAKGGMVFASYASPGKHRNKVHPHKNFEIHLGKEGFWVNQ